MKAVSDVTPARLTANGRLWWFRGDGTERCLVCHDRNVRQSWYVGQVGVITDDLLPERYPVCSREHGHVWMAEVWRRALGVSEW